MARRSGSGVILVSLIIALILSVLPLPENLQSWRPEWVLLVLFYWLVALPERIGFGVAWSLGIILDVMEGSLLGLNALALTVVTYFSLLFYQRLRMFSWLQQALSVFVLVALNQLLCHWIKGILGSSVQTLMFLVPAFVSALLWPWVFVVMRGVRRNFNVN